MKTIVLSLFMSLSFVGISQESLSDLLNRHTTKSIPYISVEELAMPKTNATILDAREVDEYNISHLKNALHVGYDQFQLEHIKKQLPNKDEAIVVYCSLGIRSEKIGAQLKKAGYTNIKNLYGGIFEWKNKGFEIYNSKNKVTDSIHVFSKTWRKWSKNGIQVYE